MEWSAVMRSLLLLGVCVSLSQQSSLGREKRYTPVPEADEDEVVHPVQDFLPHRYEGAYIDQVQGKDYTCQPDVALAIDFSTSLGLDFIKDMVEPFIQNFLSQLSRLPKEPGDDTFGSRFTVSSFTKDARTSTINTRGMSKQGLAAKLSENLDIENQVGNGSCISCGLDAARDALLEEEEEEEESHKKYVVLLSDGMDNDAQGNNPDTPVFAASENRILGGGIYHFVVGVRGQSNKLNETLLRLIANAPDKDSYWTMKKKSETNNIPRSIVDTIAGASCMGF